MTISQLSAQERLRATMAAAALRTNAASAAPAESVARQPDAVSISDTARSLAAARNAVGAVPDVREDKINALKAAIAAGTYSIDSRQLATAMVKSIGT